MQSQPDAPIEDRGLGTEVVPYGAEVMSLSAYVISMHIKVSNHKYPGLQLKYLDIRPYVSVPGYPRQVGGEALSRWSKENPRRFWCFYWCFASLDWAIVQ